MGNNATTTWRWAGSVSGVWEAANWRDADGVAVDDWPAGSLPTHVVKFLAADKVGDFTDGFLSAPVTVARVEIDEGFTSGSMPALVDLTTAVLDCFAVIREIIVTVEAVFRGVGAIEAGTFSGTVTFVGTMDHVIQGGIFNDGCLIRLLGAPTLGTTVYLSDCTYAALLFDGDITIETLFNVAIEDTLEMGSNPTGQGVTFSGDVTVKPLRRDVLCSAQWRGAGKVSVAAAYAYGFGGGIPRRGTR